MPIKDTPKIDEKWFSATDEEMRELIRDYFPKKAKSAEPKCAGLKDRIRALDAELIADGVTMITHRPAEPDATEGLCDLCGTAVYGVSICADCRNSPEKRI